MFFTHIPGIGRSRYLSVATRLLSCEDTQQVRDDLPAAGSEAQVATQSDRLPSPGRPQPNVWHPEGEVVNSENNWRLLVAVTAQLILTIYRHVKVL